jgi:hypothetical protein
LVSIPLFSTFSTAPVTQAPQHKEKPLDLLWRTAPELFKQLGSYVFMSCNKFFFRIIILTQALSFSLFAADDIAQNEAPAWITELSYRVVNNRTVVLVEANGHELHLVLDTGATKTALFQSDDETFSDFQIVGKSQIIFPALDETVEGKKLAPFDIKIGDIIFSPEKPLLVSSRPPIGDRLNFRFDGVLGQDFFHSFIVETIPDTGKMKLYANGTDLKGGYRSEIKLQFKRSAAHMDFYTKMPWEQQAQRKTMLLDTGYPGVMIFWSTRHFETAMGKSKARALREDNTGVFTKATFKVGKVRFVNAPVFLSPHVPKQASRRDGVIGSNVLAGQKHAIDFSSGKLYLSSTSFQGTHIDGEFYVPNSENFIYRRFFAEPTRKTLTMFKSMKIPD